MEGQESSRGAALQEDVMNQQADRNYDQFRATVEKEVKKADSENYTVGLCMIYLDALPETSEGYNSVFQELAWVIQDEAKVQGELVVYSYMNLAVLMPKTLSVDIIDSANTLKTTIAKTNFQMNGRAIRTTASIGVAVYPDSASSAEELITKAHAALGTARERGGDAVVAC